MQLYKWPDAPNTVSEYSIYHFMLLSAAVSFALTAGLVVCSHLDTATNDPAYYYLDEQDVTFDRQPKNIVIATSIGGSSVSCLCK